MVHLEYLETPPQTVQSNKLIQQWLRRVAEPQSSHSPLWWQLLWTSSATTGERRAALPWSPWQQEETLKHRQDWTTTLNDLSGTLHWIPGLQSLMQLSRTPQRVVPHTPSLYPTPTLTEHSLSPPPSPCLCQSLCHLIHPDVSWLTHQSPLLEDLCGLTNLLLKAGTNV